MGENGICIAFATAIFLDFLSGGGSFPLSVYGGGIESGRRRFFQSDQNDGIRLPPYAATPSCTDTRALPLYLSLIAICVMIAVIAPFLAPGTGEMPILRLVASFFIYIEPILAALVLSVHAYCRGPFLNRVLFALGIIVLWCTSGHMSPTPEMLSLNAFAPIHIACARTAKILIFAAMCSAISGERNASHLVTAAFAFQGSALVFGMIWAFSAPDWGNLWQWDFIELTALAVFLGLYGWMSSHRQARVWGPLTAVLWLIQWFVVYQGGAGDLMTRHQYSDLSENAANIVLMAFYIGFLPLCLSPRHSRFPVCGIQLAVAAAILGIVIVVASGGVLPPSVMYAAFGVLWICLVFSSNRRHWPRAAFGAAAVIWLAFLPNDAGFRWAQIDSASDEAWHLDGIQARNGADDCTDYRASVYYGVPGASVCDVTMRDCSGIRGPVGHADIVLSSGIRRVWCVDYRAVDGALLLVRSTTWDWLFILYLLVMLAGYWGAFVHSETAGGSKCRFQGI